MEIGSSYGVNSLWDLTSTAKIDPASSRTYRTVERQTTYSGDSVEISDEARQLYSEMIHKYDTSASQKSGANAEQGGGQSGGAGESSDSSSSVESLKKQIQSLKSQLAALASQAGNGSDAGVMGKMNALQSQIAALEAQLNEAQAAA